MLGGIQVGQNFSPVESGKVLKHSGQYNDDFGFSWTAVLAERQFGQVGSGGGDLFTTEVQCGASTLCYCKEGLAAQW